MDSTKPQGAVPPGGGRQDHYAMRADAMRALTGRDSGETESPVPEPIPGEHDATTLTHPQPGAIGGCVGGACTPSPDAGTWMDAETARLHKLEGGGA